MTPKSIGRRATVNRTGNKSSGKVKAQQLVTEHAFVIPPSRTTLEFPPIALPRAADQVGIGLYLKTEPGKTISLEVTAETRAASGKWVVVAQATWVVKDVWTIHGFFITDKSPITAVRLRATSSAGARPLFAWGYAAGPCEDLAPKVEKDIRLVDPEVAEERLAYILELIRKGRFKYLETAYLDHAGGTLDGMTGVVRSQEPIICKCCSLCERLLPVVSFHSHSMFPSGYQLECKACKNCNINPKLNYKRTKQQLLESTLIRRELEYFAEENKFLREHPNFLKELFAKFKNRCFNCGAPVDRTSGHVDHTRPLVGLWPLDEHATVLCSHCNNEKHDKYPIEFYRDPEKRKELARITGLTLKDVEAKRMNSMVLARIIKNVPKWYAELKSYAASHEDFKKVVGVPDKSFRAVARRAKELENVDLYELYKKQAGKPFPGNR